MKKLIVLLLVCSNLMWATSSAEGDPPTSGMNGDEPSLPATDLKSTVMSTTSTVYMNGRPVKVYTSYSSNGYKPTIPQGMPSFFNSHSSSRPIHQTGSFQGRPIPDFDLLLSDFIQELPVSHFGSFVPSSPIHSSTSSFSTSSFSDPKKPTSQPNHHASNDEESSTSATSPHSQEEDHNSCDLCGLHQERKGRIVGGYESKNRYLWMAGLAQANTNHVFCGGAIITQYHILSAAHCIARKNAREIMAFIGGHEKSERGNNVQRIPVVATKAHPEYRKEVGPEDIAVITLSRKIDFTKAGAVCLPKTGEDMAGQELKAIGWGLTSFKGEGSPVLREAMVKVSSAETCSRSWRHLLSPNNTQFCTDTHTTDTCQGDSGGPLVQRDLNTDRYVLRGLVSFGTGCLSGKPAVNSFVFPFLPWIKKAISESPSPKGVLCA